jgi:hypothetical protein
MKQYPDIALKARELGPIYFYARTLASHMKKMKDPRYNDPGYTFSAGANYKPFEDIMSAREVETCKNHMMETLYVMEGLHYSIGRPYFKVWPSIAESLRHTDMPIQGEHFRMPYQVFEVRFPDHEDNPMRPCSAMLCGLAPGHLWKDGREHTLVLLFVMEDKTDVVGNTWMGDIPIKEGLSLEDALNETALQEQCPNPDLVRGLMRIAVGVAFFGVDRHEVVLPELPRKVIDQYFTARKVGNLREEEQVLRQARTSTDGLGWKVGSEIDLPTALVVTHYRTESEESGRHLTHSHPRRGYMGFRACGEGRVDRRLCFIPPTIVRPDLPMGAGHGYRIKG